MKKILTCCLLLSFVTGLFAQPLANLDYNNVEARINGDGALFYDIANQMGGFEVPRNSGKNILYFANLWVTGVDAVTDSIYASADAYEQDGHFANGPIATNYNEDYYSRYSRVWIVDKAAIENHRYNWNTPGYVMPYAIESWPGNGLVSNGEAAQLAPFADRNNNGIYEPEKGDFPCILGDQAVYVIFNDDNERDVAKFGNGLGIEVHLMAYEIVDTTAVNNTVFLSYKIFNRSNRNYKDFRLGFWADTEVGCAGDDLIGCDTSLNAFFGYNGDTLDEDCNGVLGYQSQIPAVGIVFLNHDLYGFLSSVNGNAPYGDPNTVTEKHGYLNMIWKDGKHLTEGGTGYGGTVNTNYMYPADPNSSTGWNEKNAGNFPFDRRGLGIIEPTALASFSTFEFDAAVVYSYSADKSKYFRSIDKLKSDIVVVKNVYQNLKESCETIVGINDDIKTDKLVLYPNPVNDRLYLKNGDLTPKKVIVYDILGSVIKESNSGEKFLDLGALTNGVYFISIDWGTEVTTNRIVVKH